MSSAEKKLDSLYRKNLIIAKTMRYGESIIRQVYPGWNKDELADLLVESWSRPYIFQKYVHFRERPFHGKYINVHEAGFRSSINQGPWPPDRDKYFTIFLFGGSTTFGYGVPDNQTIASHLQTFFTNIHSEKEIRIYNFGQGHYYSTQERILFQELIAAGYKPDLALFIDGLNEFFYYDEDHAPYASDFAKLVRGELWSLWLKSMRQKSFFMTITQWKKSFRALFFNRQRRLQKNRYNHHDPSRIQCVINRFMMNKRMIEAVAASYSISTQFIWEPVPTYNYDLSLHPYAAVGFGRHTYSQTGYPAMKAYLEQHPEVKDLLWCADIHEGTTEPLYVDIVHYSPLMSQMIAEQIFQYLIKKLSYFNQ